MDGEFTITAHDGLTLVGSHWPARGVRRGHAVLVHGLGEHRLRYRALAEALADAGWSLTAIDQRGHGASPGPRGDVPTPEALLDDLGRVLDHVRQRASTQGDDGAPLVLIGHSLGGVIAARMVAEGLADRPAAWWRPVDALLLSSPALDPGLRPWQKGLLALARRAFPHLAVGNGLQPGWVSRDPAVVRAYATDPLVHDRVTAATTVFLLDAAGLVQQRASRWRLPTLLLWAGADRCVRPEGSARFAAAAAPSGALTGKAYPGLYHELFNEPERALVIGDALGWLTRSVPRPTTPA